MKELNAWTVTGMDSVPLTLSEHTAPDQRLQRAEAEVRRLTRCMEMKDRQLCELRKALAHSATVHYSFENRLQRELDSLRILMPVNEFQEHRGKSASDRPEEAIVVKLPYFPVQALDKDLVTEGSEMVTDMPDPDGEAGYAG